MATDRTMDVLPLSGPLAPPTEPETTDILVIVERLSRDPNSSVDKIERLMALWERGQAKRAEQAFNAAMSAAQKAMRTIGADATNPQTRSRYASYEAIDRAIRPVYTGHGFGLSFDTGHDAPPDYVRVLCYVTHVDGHARTYHADMPADGKGAKGGDVMTKTHAVGSAMSYGMRYLLKMIFNVAVGDEDDDGNRAGQQTAPPPAPAGLDTLLLDLSSVADNGIVALRAAWKEVPEATRDYITTHEATKWANAKTKATARDNAARTGGPR